MYAWLVMNPCPCYNNFQKFRSISSDNGFIFLRFFFITRFANFKLLRKDLNCGFGTLGTQPSRIKYTTFLTCHSITNCTIWTNQKKISIIWSLLWKWVSTNITVLMKKNVSTKWRLLPIIIDILWQTAVSTGKQYLFWLIFLYDFACRASDTIRINALTSSKIVYTLTLGHF